MKQVAVVCLLCVAAFAEIAEPTKKPSFEFKGVRILAPVVAADIPKLKQQMNCDSTLGCAITVKDGKITYVYFGFAAGEWKAYRTALEERYGKPDSQNSSFRMAWYRPKTSKLPSQLLMIDCHDSHCYLTISAGVVYQPKHETKE